MPPEDKNRTVLLLEDEPIIGKIMARMLKVDGLEVDIAENGLIAKKKIDAGNKYLFYIFDIRTPVISGIELYEYIEENYPELTRLIIFTTGDCLNSATGEFLDRIDRPYLTKPYTPLQIRTLLKNTFGPDIFPGHKED